MANERIDMIKIRQILRLNNEKVPQRQIVKLLATSRKTVAKYIVLFEASGLDYQGIANQSDEQLHEYFFEKEKSQSDRYETLLSLLPKMEKELRRVGVTKFRLWEEYKRENPGGYNYTQYCLHLNNWLKKHNAVMHFEHKAGDKLFVDFTGKHLHITDRKTGELTEVEVFVAILGSSQMTYVEAVRSQQKEDFITAVENSLIYYNGVPLAIVPDNLKSGVTKSCLYEPKLNEDFRNFALHYGTTILPTRSSKPRDKALVENAVRNVYYRIFAELRDRIFFSIDDLNEAIYELLDKYNGVNFQKRSYSRYDLFKEVEQKELHPLPKEKYEQKEYVQLTVNKNCHIWLKSDEHYYSVPFRFIGKKVKVIYSCRAVEIYLNHTRIAVHKRDYHKYKYSTIKEHMPSAHQFVSDWNPEKFINWASDIGKETEQYIRRILDSKQHPEQGYKSCIGILQYAKKYGRERLNNACRRGIYYNSYNYKVIQNILKNNLDKTEIERENQYRLPLHENVRGSSYYN